MASRPTNHVTRAQARLEGGEEVNLPVLDNEALERLEALFAPRCLDPKETVEDHLRFAGAVALVQALRSTAKARAADVDQEEDDLGPAERAA